MTFSNTIRFSLRTLLFATALVGACCGVVVERVQRIKADTAAESAAIRAMKPLATGYSCTTKDYGVLNFFVAETDRQRVQSVFLYGTATKPEEYEREVITVLSQFKELSYLRFYIPNVKREPSMYVDIHSIEEELGVTSIIDTTML